MLSVARGSLCYFGSSGYLFRTSDTSTHDRYRAMWN